MGRETRDGGREGRDRDRDAHSHSMPTSESSRRVIDANIVTPSTNPLSRLGKVVHEGNTLYHSTASSVAVTHPSDPHSSAQPSAASSSSQVTMSTPTVAGPSSQPTSSTGEANLTTQQALQTLQQALLMAKGKNAPSGGGGGEPPYSSAPTQLAGPSGNHASISRHNSNNNANANFPSSATRMSPATAADDRSKGQQQQHSNQASPFQAQTNAPSSHATHGSVRVGLFSSQPLNLMVGNPIYPSFMAQISSLKAQIPRLQSQIPFKR